jgi:hypothetical protein
MNERTQMRPYRLGGLTAATLLAALAPALVVGSLPALVDGSLGQSIQTLQFALCVTLAHTIVLGLPCFFILESRRRVNLFSAITAGFAVGALPFGILDGILASMPAGNFSASATVVYGVLFGLFGALAGLVFWITLKAWGWRAAPAEIIATLPRRTRFVRIGGSAGTLVLAVLLTTGVFAIHVIWDRTCHNPFRDGRTLVRSQANMYVSVGMDEWPKLTEIFERFAPAHGMSTRNSSLNRSGVRVLSLSLCTERGTNIELHDQRWAHKDFASLYGWGAPIIMVYELRESSGWQKLAADLLVEVGAAFPGKVQFRDGQGRRVIPTPPELGNGRTNE